ncbi:MAG: cation diffusion facilitator family transporter [Acidimicrobiia bacterium]|nr:cation diffusion facilitator family transporter [Acidimicrobiia bacterium]
MSSESRSLVILALIANSIIAVIKFVAAGISGSSAMLAEGFHSVADSGNQLFLLRGTAVSRYAPDVRHPFGHGKQLFFWSFMVAVVLFVGGSVVALLEGWEHVFHPEEPQNLALNLTVLALAALFEYSIAFRPALKQFNRMRGGRGVMRTVREAKDPALLVVLFEDTAAMIGVAIAGIGVLLANITGNGRWDGAASIMVGLLLAGTAWILAFETKALLVGEAATREDRSSIRAASLAVPELVSVGKLLTMHMGSDKILVNIEADFKDGLSDDQVEAAIDKVEANIRAAVPSVGHIFVELQSPQR